jgi:hypothetical protein
VALDLTRMCWVSGTPDRQKDALRVEVNCAVVVLFPIGTMSGQSE